ncbi:hypothetical protein BDZ85DRAFT_258399, partial [Elsinoe ampelina]
MLQRKVWAADCVYLFLIQYPVCRASCLFFCIGNIFSKFKSTPSCSSCTCHGAGRPRRSSSPMIHLDPLGQVLDLLLDADDL